MFIEKPDRLIASKLLYKSSKYIHSKFRNDWLNNFNNIIKEDAEFLNQVYNNSLEYQIMSIDNNSFIIFGPRFSLDCFYIYELFIAEEARGKGYGTALLNYAIEYFRKMQKYGFDLENLQLDVDKENYSALEFYKKNEFEIIEEKDISYLMQLEIKKSA